MQRHRPGFASSSGTPLDDGTWNAGAHPQDVAAPGDRHATSAGCPSSEHGNSLTVGLGTVSNGPLGVVEPPGSNELGAAVPDVPISRSKVPNRGGPEGRGEPAPEPWHRSSESTA